LSRGGTAIIACGHLGNVFPRLGDHGHGQANCNNCFNRIEQLCHSPSRWGFNFIEDFFGFNLKQRLSRVNRFSLGLKPFLDCPFDHGQAELGHDNFYRHDFPLPSIMNR
jgi:hypothetical protein